MQNFCRQGSALEALCEQLRLLHPLHQLTDYTRRTLQWQTHLVQSMQHVLAQEDQRLHAVIGRLEALSPLAVLARGYSITFRLPERHVLTDASSVRPGEQLETKLATGSVVSTVTHPNP